MKFYIPDTNNGQQETAAVVLVSLPLLFTSTGLKLMHLVSESWNTKIGRDVRHDNAKQLMSGLFFPLLFFSSSGHDFLFFCTFGRL